MGAPMEPSEAQLAYAKKLGITVPEGATWSQISSMIDAVTGAFDLPEKVTSRPSDVHDGKPSKQRIDRANRLGIKFDPDISKSKLNELIQQVEMNLPPTKEQLKACEGLGISVQEGENRGEIVEGIRVAKSNIPFDDELLKLERLGIPVPPNATRNEITKMLDGFRNDPAYQEKLLEMEAQEERDEIIEQYGELIAEELLKWEKIVHQGQPHIIIHKRGKKIMSEILEIHDATIREGKPCQIELSGYAPSDLKYMDKDDEISFDKEIELIASRVLHVQMLPPHVFPLTLGRYRIVLPQLKEYAKRFESEK
jgi:hypothetical protein